jgi:hypothetical protein
VKVLDPEWPISEADMHRLGSAVVDDLSGGHKGSKFRS